MDGRAVIEVLFVVGVCLALGAGGGVAMSLAVLRRRDAEIEAHVRRGPGPVVGSGSPASRLQWPFRPAEAAECPGCLSSRVRGATFCHRCGRVISPVPVRPAPAAVTSLEPLLSPTLGAQQRLDLGADEAPGRAAVRRKRDREEVAARPSGAPAADARRRPADQPARSPRSPGIVTMRAAGVRLATAGTVAGLEHLRANGAGDRAVRNQRSGG